MINAPAMFASLAQGVSAVFGGPFVAGQVIDQADVDLDEGGSIPEGVGDPTIRPCQLQVDSVTEAMRQADGYAEGDVRFLILSATLGGGLSTDAQVEVLEGPYAGLWLVSDFTRDPAAIYFEGRGRRAPNGE